MPFQSGNKLSLGRPMGSKNKKIEVAERLKALNFDVLKEIVKTCKNPKIKLGDRLRGLIALAEFIYPKRKAIEISGELGLGLLPDTKEDRTARIIDLNNRLEAKEDDAEIPKQAAN